MSEKHIRTFLSKSAAGNSLTIEEQEKLEIWYDGFAEHQELTFSLEEDRTNMCTAIKEGIFSRIGIPVPVHMPVSKKRFVVPELLLRILVALSVLVVATGIWIWVSLRQEQNDNSHYISVSVPPDQAMYRP